MCLIYVFGALAITSGVFSQDTSNIQPEIRDLFVAVGSSVKIPCTDGEEKGVELRFNSSVLVSSPVLSIQNTSLKDQGIYTCNQLNGDLIQTVSLHLGCRIIYPMRCDWPNTSSVSFSDPLASACQCQKWGEQDSEPTLINITAINALGSTTHIWPIIFQQIVKPDPPVNWGPPPTWPDPVKFLLKYTMKFHWGKPETARTESNKMVLSGLVAGRTYYIQISAKDSLDDGQSSEWSHR
uniref:Epstein-Barr virus induced 3 n=1 Tax=Sinocyclocheilus grahami TaxID=75366 RepID=A0A672T7D7_SINGR